MLQFTVAPSNCVDPESTSIDRQTERFEEMEINDNAEQLELSVNVSVKLH